MIKHLICILLGLVASVTALSQQVLGYEFEREMPVFLDQIKKELKYPLAWKNATNKKFKKWKKLARNAVFDAMLAPPHAPSDFQLEIISEEYREGYRAQKIQFNLTEYSRVNAYLLTPDGEGPFPAIILLHDHGGHYSIGKEKMIYPFDTSIEVLEDAKIWVTNCYGGQFVGDYLAKNGYAVISVDALFWGERGRKEGIDGDRHMVIAGNMMMLGRNWSGFMNYEDLYTTDFLSTLPQIDSERIGCMGFSMGGYRAWMLSALSDKISAAACVCWMTTTSCQLSWEYGKEIGGFANTLPALRQYLDYPHIASIACPKPMYFINGEHDILFPPIGVQAAYDEMHSVWSSQHAKESLITEIWNMSHDCGIIVQKSILDFFDKWFKSD